MKTTITPPPEQEPTITLDLSVDEFVALFGLYYAGGTGNTSLRNRIETEFYRVKRVNMGTILARAMVAFEQDGERSGGVFHRVERALEKARS